MQRNLRLVIADDEEPMRLLVKTLLSFVEHVEVVAEAVDGEEAVRLVQEHDPDLLLLDVRMPRLDGLAAAEMIRTLRPHTHIVLHSSDADAEMHRRARTLGLRLLDKMRVEQVVDTLVQPAVGEVRALPDARIEAAILTALTGRATTPLIIVGADGRVPFYNSHAGELLGLPLPPRETDVDTVRQRYRVLRPDDHTPVEPDQRPIDRSAREHEPVTETLIVFRNGTETLCRFTSIPFHNDRSQFMGAALHVEPLADLSEVDGT